MSKKYLDYDGLAEVVAELEDRYVRFDTNAQNLDATEKANARTNIGAQGTIDSNNKLSADLIADGSTNKAYTGTEKTKLSGIASGAQVNVIETVKVNGTALTPSSKAVDVTVPTKTSDLTNDGNGTSNFATENYVAQNGGKIDVIKVNGTAQTITNKAVDISVPTNTNQLTNGAGFITKSVNDLTNYYTKSQIDGTIASVYKPAGSVAFANLPTLAANVLGNVYNVTDAFTTTAAFVEGSGKNYPAGTNVVVISVGTNTYLFDVLAGMVDLSGYQTLITSSNKISADNVSDSGTTNKFVTATEKTTWNGKMDTTNPTGTGSFSLNRRAGSTVGSSSVAVGNNTTASGELSFAEGNITVASNVAAHAEGANTTASGEESHAEGWGTTASGNHAHAEGQTTTASGANAHAEGIDTTASGNYSHAEGSATTASGARAHAEGYGTIAQRKLQHVFGKLNVADTAGSNADSLGDYIEIVGNGTAENARSNARTLDWSGNEVLAGTSQATGFKTANGTSSQFLKADGSVDSTSYAPAATVADMPDTAITTAEIEALFS